MLLSDYTKNIFQPECNANLESVHCVVGLNGDVGVLSPILMPSWEGSSIYSIPRE